VLRSTSRFISRHYCRNRKTCYERFGREGAYVLVTGALAEIGFQVCSKMASQGFNIFMIDALCSEERAAELQREFGVLVRWLVADMSQMTQIE